MLHTLDASYNEISELSDHHASMYSLQTLNLSHNFLSAFPASFYSNTFVFHFIYFSFILFFIFFLTIFHWKQKTAFTFWNWICRTINWASFLSASPPLNRSRNWMSVTTISLTCLLTSVNATTSCIWFVFSPLSFLPLLWLIIYSFCLFKECGV